MEGGVAIGSNYSGRETGPPDGIIVEGNVGIGTPVAAEKLVVKVGGSHWTDPHFSLEAYDTSDTWDFTIGGENRFFIGYNESSKIVVDVDGNIEITGEYKYASSKIYYKSIPVHAVSELRHISIGYQASWAIGDFGEMFIDKNSTTDCAKFVADPDLPQGATVEKFIAWYRDNNSISDLSITAILQRIQLSSQPYTPMASINQISSGSNEDLRSFFDSTIEYGTVDNQNYMYGITVTYCDLSDHSLDHVRLAFYGLQIEYTLDVVTP